MGTYPHRIAFWLYVLYNALRPCIRTTSDPHGISYVYVAHVTSLPVNTQFG
jgi:hypothetical protein